MRALLDLMRDNETALQKLAAEYATLLKIASQHLTIFDPTIGKKELIKALASTVAKIKQPH